MRAIVKPISIGSIDLIVRIEYQRICASRRFGLRLDHETYRSVISSFDCVDRRTRESYELQLYYVIKKYEQVSLHQKDSLPRI